jgi:hypothetical protein
MNIRNWVRNGALFGIALAAACGGTVISSQTGGTTGSGGAGGATTVVGVGGSTTDVCPCCDGQCSDVSTTTVSSSSGAGGGGAICGGLPGFVCPAGQYCEFPDQMCGGNDDEGTCAQRPQGCPEIVDPTCGCDHQVYPSPCDAAAAGADIDDLGGCTPPAGTFGCGAHFCKQDAEYCEIFPDGTSAGTSTYVCQPMPSNCGNPPTCACLSSAGCGGDCMTSNDGDGLEIVCAGL